MGLDRSRLSRLEEAAAARPGRPRRVEDLSEAELRAIVERDAGRPDGERRSAADFGYFELWEILRVHCQYFGIDVPANLPAGDKGETLLMRILAKAREIAAAEDSDEGDGWPGGDGDQDQDGGGGPVPVGAAGAAV